MGASYTFMALLSDLGGALGLVMGATLITVFEVGEFSYQLIRELLQMNSSGGNETKHEPVEVAQSLKDRRGSGTSWTTRGSVSQAKIILVNEACDRQGL